MEHKEKDVVGYRATIEGEGTFTFCADCRDFWPTFFGFPKGEPILARDAVGLVCEETGCGHRLDRE